MKYFCVFILSAVSGFGANQFVTNQAARAVIGQAGFTTADQGASASLVGGVSGLAYAGNTLFVADSNRVSASPINNRVLIFPGLSSFLPSPTAQFGFGGPRCTVCVGSASVVLGQPDFVTTTFTTTQTGMRLPTAVASDGKILAVADTDNNRVLIWNTIPDAIGAPADVVVGQPDFVHSSTAVPPNPASLRGPQGVWIQDGKLYIADTQDHRVVIFNSIPKSNGASADLVLGQKDLNTFVEPDLTKSNPPATADNLLNPIAVTSDGQRLYVTDIGHNRVLIWNSIPTTNQAPADVAVGQADLVSSTPDDSTVLCASNGTDTSGNLTYPALCEKTLSFPRFALSDGHKLFIADGGNDRVLIYNSVPETSGKSADVVLGEPDFVTDFPTDGTNSMRTPMSLAWDGSNLFVSDVYNVRILVFSPGEPNLPANAVHNAASLEVYAIGSVVLAGSIQAKDTVTVTIDAKDYTYTIASGDTFDTVVNQLVALINAGSGDPNVLASPDLVTQAIILTARQPGTAGNAVTLGAAVSSSAMITATASGVDLFGGQDSATIAPGTLISVSGTNLSDFSGIAPTTGTSLPDEIAGTRVYVDGMPSPLLYVSATQINAQMPFEVRDADSVSVWVRTVRADGTTEVTVPIGVTIVPASPGIFALGGKDPRPAVAFHAADGYANGSISVDGTINAGDVATVTIQSRSYTYTVLSTDTLATVRDALVAEVDKDSAVHASAANAFTRIDLQARVKGSAGDGIAYGASVNSGASLILTPADTALCCASEGMITAASPAVPGETIRIFATGLGVLTPSDSEHTGSFFPSGQVATAQSSVSALTDGVSANVITATLQPGMVGVYLVELGLSTALTTDPLTQLTIAQDVYVSNIVTFPVKAP